MVSVDVERAHRDVVVVVQVRGHDRQLQAYLLELPLHRLGLGHGHLAGQPPLAEERDALGQLDGLAVRDAVVAGDAERGEAVGQHRILDRGGLRDAGQGGAPGLSRRLDVRVAQQHGIDEGGALELGGALEQLAPVGARGRRRRVAAQLDQHVAVAALVAGRSAADDHGRKGCDVLAGPRPASCWLRSHLVLLRGACGRTAVLFASARKAVRPRPRDQRRSEALRR